MGSVATTIEASGSALEATGSAVDNLLTTLNVRPPDLPKSRYRNEYCNITFGGDNGTDVRAYILHPETRTRNVKYAIVLHGQNCDRLEIVRVAKLERFANRGYSLLVPDYRGSGDSDETIDKDKVNKDLKACFRYFTKNYPGERFIAIGHSLGAAMLLEYCKYATQHELRSCFFPAMLFLIAPFVDSTKISGLQGVGLRIAKTLFPIAENYSYKSSENIRYVDRHSTYIIHGMADELVPISAVEELAKIGGVELIMLDADHNGIISSKGTWRIIHTKIKQCM